MGLNHFSDMTAKLPTFLKIKCWMFFYFRLSTIILFNIIFIERENGKKE